MSLKVEQRIENHQFTEFTPRIYTTGAYLVPMKVEVNGENRYVWVVEGFDEASYNDEGLNVSPNVYAEKISELLEDDDDEI